jgi:hypothetical protein
MGKKNTKSAPPVGDPPPRKGRSAGEANLVSVEPDETTANKKRKARGQQPHVNENSTFVATQPKKKAGTTGVDADAAAILANLSKTVGGKRTTKLTGKAAAAAAAKDDDDEDDEDSDGSGPPKMPKKAAGAAPAPPKPSARKAAPKNWGSAFSSILMHPTWTEKQKSDYIRIIQDEMEYNAEQTKTAREHELAVLKAKMLAKESSDAGDRKKKRSSFQAETASRVRVEKARDGGEDSPEQGAGEGGGEEGEERPGNSEHEDAAGPH